MAKRKREGSGAVKSQVGERAAMSTTSKTRLPSIGRPPSQFSNNANLFGNGSNTNNNAARTPSLHKGSDGMKDNGFEKNEQGEAQDDLEMYVSLFLSLSFSQLRFCVTSHSATLLVL